MSHFLRHCVCVSMCALLYKNVQECAILPRESCGVYSRRHCKHIFCAAIEETHRFARNTLHSQKHTSTCFEQASQRTPCTQAHGQARRQAYGQQGTAKRCVVQTFELSRNTQSESKRSSDAASAASDSRSMLTPPVSFSTASIGLHASGVCRYISTMFN